MGLRFRFRGIAFVATVVLVALGIGLGNWQVRRAGEKEGIAAAMRERGALPPVILGDRSGVQGYDRVGTGALRGPAHPMEFQTIRVTGQFVADWPIFLDNRPYRGRVGFYLAMPFKIAGSDQHVMVLRGWLPRDARDYLRLPEYATPQGTTTIEGLVMDRAGHVFQLGKDVNYQPAARVLNLDLDKMAHASRLALAPFVVQQTGPQLAGETLVRDWPAPDTGIDKHRGYAFQWYALAAMAALFFVITGFRSGRKQVE